MPGQRLVTDRSRPRARPARAPGRPSAATTRRRSAATARSTCRAPTPWRWARPWAPLARSPTLTASSVVRAARDLAHPIDDRTRLLHRRDGELWRRLRRVLRERRARHRDRLAGRAQGPEGPRGRRRRPHRRRRLRTPRGRRKPSRRRRSGRAATVEPDDYFVPSDVPWIGRSDRGAFILGRRRGHRGADRTRAHTPARRRARRSQCTPLDVHASSTRGWHPAPACAILRTVRDERVSRWR